MRRFLVLSALLLLAGCQKLEQPTGPSTADYKWTVSTTEHVFANISDPPATTRNSDATLDTTITRDPLTGHVTVVVNKANVHYHGTEGDVTYNSETAAEQARTDPAIAAVHSHFKPLLNRPIKFHYTADAIHSSPPLEKTPISKILVGFFCEPAVSANLYPFIEARDGTPQTYMLYPALDIPAADRIGAVVGPTEGGRTRTLSYEANLTDVIRDSKVEGMMAFLLARDDTVLTFTGDAEAAFDHRILPRTHEASTTLEYEFSFMGMPVHVAMTSTAKAERLD